MIPLVSSSLRSAAINSTKRSAIAGNFSRTKISYTATSKQSNQFAIPTKRSFQTSSASLFKSSSAKMVVNSIESHQAWNELIEKHRGSGGVFVLDAFATWCGPCKAMSPVVDKFSETFQNVEFYKFDVDNSPEITQELGVRAMPTFFIFKDGEMVDTVVGASPPKLEQAISKHST